jgi:hypothetical protein
MNAPNGNKKQLLASIKSTIKYLANHHIKTAIIGQTESYTISYPFIAAREYQYNIHLRHRYINQETAELNQFLKVNLSPYYLNIYNTGDVSKLTPDTVPYMFDSDHYTKPGADLAVAKILQYPIVTEMLVDTE